MEGDKAVSTDLSLHPRLSDTKIYMESFMETRPRAGLRPAGPRLIVGRVQFSWVHFSRLASRLRRSARRVSQSLNRKFRWDMSLMIGSWRL